MNEKTEEKPHENEQQTEETTKEEGGYDLKAEIKSLGMSQKEFAKMIDIHINTISQWVRGINETPQWVKVLIFHYRRSMMFDVVKNKIIEIENNWKWSEIPQISK